MTDRGPGGISTFLSRMKDLLGSGGLLTDVAAREVYARDASHMTLGRPLAVALPRNDDQLKEVVRLCREECIPVVCRGTGTGLSGGAVPAEGALVLGTSRMMELGPVDADDRRVRVQPGVLNDRVSRHALSCGLHFAPDPSSQAAASIGGNIAENAGGPHCLRHGVTLQHLFGLRWCDSGGRLWATGRGISAERGLDLVSLLCGSEGTLGVVTAADLKLEPNPEAEATLLAFFPDLQDAARAVVSLLGEGLAPVAVEMVDQAMLQAVEAAFAFGFPTDVEAAMIVEFAGQPEEVDEDGRRAATLLREGGAREVRLAADEAERIELWKCRQKAFGAVGRLAPCYVTMDVVVPLGELPGLVRRIQDIRAEHGVDIATAFHAGDGNLHPGVHYDDRDPEQTRRAHAAADTIIKAALDRGGSVTGEHGVGIEKLHALPWQIDAETDRLQRGIKRIFDPAGILNPGKLHPPEGAEFAPVRPTPSGVTFRWENLTVSAPAATPLVEIQAEALARGFWIPIGVPAMGPAAEAGFGLGRSGTVGDLVGNLVTGPALCPGGTARDYLLELWAETGDGRTFHTGAPVFKNVAGYDLAHMLCGSGGVFVRHLAATFQLRPIPEHVAFRRFSGRPNDRRFLFRLTDYLAARGGTPGSALMVFDEGDGQRDPVVVTMVPGRRRTWDLDRVDRDLTDILGGVTATCRREIPFARAGELLDPDLLPAWALESPEWISWAKMEGGGSEESRPGPEGMSRGIWQAGPRLVWSPDMAVPSPGWHADRFVAGGQVVPPGPPADGVPLRNLRQLKALFDPGCALETPSWLEGADD